MSILKTIIASNFEELCSCTDSSKPFLNSLVFQNIIENGMRTSLLAETDRESRNLVLYAFLRDSRTDQDLDGIMQALEKSKNSGAHDLFRVQKQGQTKGQDQANPVKVTAEPPGLPRSIRIFELVAILEDDAQLLQNVDTLHERFPKVKYGDVIEKLSRRDKIREILSVWRGRNPSPEATVKRLVAILEEESGGRCFQSAADAVREKVSLDGVIEP